MSSLGNEETLSPVNVSVSKKRRNLPGRPDPDAEVIALSPRSLLTTNRFVCEICNKGFQRDQNLQLHRRGHNLPWKLKQKERHEYRKKVYICPELNCVHHDPARALGDLTGIKKHFSRKHGEKKWKCDKCSKKYAVQSDWKAHQKTCGTKEYRCDCGYLFSRKDSFITHRAYCDVHENSKDPPFNDEQAQKLAASPDEAANRNTIERDIPAPIDSTSSPVSPVVGDDPTCVEYPKGNSTERTPDPAMAESNIAALSSKWMQGGIGANNFGSSQRSELSLCLGTDLEPGPPNEVQVLGTRNSSLPVLRYPSLGGPNKLGLSQLASSESQSSGRHVPSVGAMDMLASLFSSSAQRQAGVDNSDSVGHAFSRTEHDHYSQPAGLSSSSHDFRNAYGHAASFHTSSAATSATALLQIAAELGAKASKPFMFQRYSMAGRDSNMSMTSLGSPRESPRAGFSSNGSLMSDQLKVRESEDYLKSTEFWGSTSLSRKVDVGYVTGGLSLHGNTLLQGPFPAKMHDNITSTFRDGHLKERGTSSTILRDPCFGVQVGCVQDEVAGLPRGDCEKRMVDFLGVNARGAVGRSSGDMVETSRKNLASMTSLTAEFRVPERFLSPNGSVG